MLISLVKSLFITEWKKLNKCNSLLNKLRTKSGNKSSSLLNKLRIKSVSHKYTFCLLNLLSQILVRH